MEEKRLALLIDAENTSPKYVEVIISELKKYGVITYQRMYGDFTSPSMTDWHKKALKNAIVPIQQPHYSSAKNASDIMLVIDAMDILYQGNTDGFCLVTSDSDFTRLVNRLRESGMLVIGMGKSDASRTFIAACNEYKFLDKIVDEETASLKHTRSGAEKKASSVTSLGDIKSAINTLIQECENDGELAYLGSVKSKLQRLYPDFDERNYGYNSMSKFITEATRFEIDSIGTATYVKRSKDASVKIESKVRAFIIEHAKENIDLALLGNMIVANYPEFKYKAYGYARLSSYVGAIDQVKVSNNIVSLK